MFLRLHIFTFLLWKWCKTTDSVQSLCQMAEVFVGLGTFKDWNKKKKNKTERRIHVSSCGWSQSLHGQPYPAAPQELLHMEQVDSQSSLQLLTHSLWAPAVCAVHGHTQAWHQQEEAGEQGQVGARWRRLIGCTKKGVSSSFRSFVLQIVSIWMPEPPSFRLDKERKAEVKPVSEDFRWLKTILQ